MPELIHLEANRSAERCFSGPKGRHVQKQNNTARACTPNNNLSRYSTACIRLLPVLGRIGSACPLPFLPCSIPSMNLISPEGRRPPIFQPSVRAVIGSVALVTAVTHMEFLPGATLFDGHAVLRPGHQIPPDGHDLAARGERDRAVVAHAPRLDEAGVGGKRAPVGH